MKNRWLQRKLGVAQSQIDRIMDQFDFAMVRNAITVLNLPYIGNDLEDHARQLLEKVAKEDDWGWIGVDIGCGFTAEKLPDGTLVLHFALELAGNF